MNMINAIAPCRINDIGGWTDTRFAKHGTVSSVAVYPGAEVQIQMPGTGTTMVYLDNYGAAYDIREPVLFEHHPFIAEAIRNNVGFEPDDIDIHIRSDMPPGASTGTSAAIVVALIGAMRELRDGVIMPSKIAKQAHAIETDLGFESGIQDQIAAAYGGVRTIYIRDYPKYDTPAFREVPQVLWELERRLILVYIGRPHASSEIHKRVIAELGENASENEYIDALRHAAAAASNALMRGDFTTYGEAMTQNTAIQEAMCCDLVSDKAASIMSIGATNGALGWKVNGAGGDGGTVTLLTDGTMEGRELIINTLRDRLFLMIPIRLAGEGLWVWRSV